MALIPRAGLKTDVEFEFARDLQAKPAITFIDLSKEFVKPQVFRDGKIIPDILLKKNVVDQIVGVAVIPGDTPRVISQSIAAGTHVSRGTKVDIILASRKKIPIDILTDVHSGFGIQDIDQVITGFLDTPVITDAVLTYATADQLPAAARTAIEGKLAAKGIAIDASKSSTSFEAAFQTLKGAAAFK